MRFAVIPDLVRNRPGPPPNFVSLRQKRRLKKFECRDGTKCRRAKSRKILRHPVRFAATPLARGELCCVLLQEKILLWPEEYGVKHREVSPLFLTDGELLCRGGIAAIYQHAASYPDLSAAENIFIGHEFMVGPFISWTKANKEAQKLLDSVGANFPATASVGSLSVAQQQLVEIAKALSQHARILIMDEPTAALSKRESEELYSIARKLRDEGVAIILISHRFEDIFGLADRATVFRDAHYIGTWNIEECDEKMLVKHMVGHEIGDFFPKKKTVIGEELLRVEKLSRTGYFRDVSFNLHTGEIVGLTGLVGAGRTEVVEAIFGITKADSGEVYINGKQIPNKRSPRSMMDMNFGLLPEDRQKQGLHLRWSINHNISLPIIDRFPKKTQPIK